MSGKKHPWGCTCRFHVDRPWERSEHWTIADVNYLDSWYGLVSDEAIAKKLGRTVVGVRLKAKRLRLHKRTQGFTARALAGIFGTDASTIGKRWIRPGFLSSRRPFRQGPHMVHLVDPRDVETFIVEHPELIDVHKMPPSWYRDLAARDPWVSLREVHRRTGRDHHRVALMIRAGKIRGARRGSHWYVPVADIPKVPPLRSREAIEESVFRRESVLEVRRARKKGVKPRARDRRAPMPVLLARTA